MLMLVDLQGETTYGLQPVCEVKDSLESLKYLVAMVSDRQPNKILSPSNPRDVTDRMPLVWNSTTTSMLLT